jgi:hypothetical protein
MIGFREENSMPARDYYHYQVKAALTKDGWTITHDPLRLQWGPKDLYVDLGAQHMLAADKGERKIAVEVKSFLGFSEVTDLERAVGQYITYQSILEETEPDRQLFLAVRKMTFLDVFEEPVGRLVMQKGKLQLIVFDEIKEEILQWIQPNISEP